jgi:hypothetical protein
MMTASGSAMVLNRPLASSAYVVNVFQDALFAYYVQTLHTLGADSFYEMLNVHV